MRMILFLSLFVTLLMGQNPKAYSAIGDTIFNNIEKIASLKNISQYKRYAKKIDNYQRDVIKAKRRGFSLDTTDNPITKKKYLKKLRVLIGTNDFFINLVNRDFIISIKTENSEFFSDIVNTGIIDTTKHKNEIIEYYIEHKESIKLRGLLEKIIDKYTKLNAKKKKKKSLSAKELQKEKIKRVREKDIKEQQALEMKLEKERMKKKSEILELR